MSTMQLSEARFTPMKSQESQFSTLVRVVSAESLNPKPWLKKPFGFKLLGVPPPVARCVARVGHMLHFVHSPATSQCDQDRCCLALQCELDGHFMIAEAVCVLILWNKHFDQGLCRLVSFGEAALFLACIFGWAASGALEAVSAARTVGRQRDVLVCCCHSCLSRQPCRMAWQERHQGWLMAHALQSALCRCKVDVEIVDTRGSHIQTEGVRPMESSQVFVPLWSGDYGAITNENIAHTQLELSC